MKGKLIAIGILSAALGCVTEKPTAQAYYKTQEAVRQYENADKNGADEYTLDSIEKEVLNAERHRFETYFSTMDPSRRNRTYESMLIVSSLKSHSDRFKIAEYARLLRSHKEGYSTEGLKELQKSLHDDISGPLWEGKKRTVIRNAEYYWRTGLISESLFQESSHPYTFTIDSEPPGAMVEVMDPISVIDSSIGEKVITGKYDWILRGKTPLKMENYPDEGDGLVTVRFSRSNHRSRVLNLKLGENEYSVELEKEE